MPAGNGRLAGLIVLDGWGLNPKLEGNAVRLARTPVMDALLARYPNATLTTCGEVVGLPEGQMGNSEVGHLNLGAGRIVYQDLTRIDKAVRDGSLARNAVLQSAFAHASRDGRDTAPRSAGPSLQAAESLLRSLGPHRIATVSGRYFAMDRDKRWART